MIKMRMTFFNTSRLIKNIFVELVQLESTPQKRKQVLSYKHISINVTNTLS